jgi:enoyl-CoA hydratase/carnithine racemase
MIVERRDGPLAIVSFNRPEVRNALTPGMFEGLRRTLDRVLADASTRGVVLTGAGKVFCGGFDLKLCLTKPGTLAQLLNDLAGAIQRLAVLDIPVVIAAHGVAIAGGCALLSGADIVVTNDSAKLGYPVTPLGISPAVSAPFMRAAVGEGRTRARLLDPELIAGREALRVGLAHECVVKPEAVLPRALAIARDLAAKPPGSYAATKSVLRKLDGGWALADAPARALSASLALVGGAEERELLSKVSSP